MRFMFFSFFRNLFTCCADGTEPPMGGRLFRGFDIYWAWGAAFWWLLTISISQPLCWQIYIFVIQASSKIFYDDNLNFWRKYFQKRSDVCTAGCSASPSVKLWKSFIENHSKSSTYYYFLCLVAEQEIKSRKQEVESSFLQVEERELVGLRPTNL